MSHRYSTLGNPSSPAAPFMRTYQDGLQCPA